MTGQIPKLKHTRSGHNSSRDVCSPAWDSLIENNTQNTWTLLVIDLFEPLINIWVSSLRFGSYMLSWMNFLILLLVYLSSVYFTLLSSNLFLSCGGRKRTIPLQTEHREVRKEDALMNLLHRSADLLTLFGCSGSGGGPQSWCEQNGIGPWARWPPSKTQPVRCSCRRQRILGKKQN